MIDKFKEEKNKQLGYAIMLVLAASLAWNCAFVMLLAYWLGRVGR